ncbi:MAG: DUF4255 domain-containing protein [Acetivibrionales bacterium]|jgi:hypothetical protein
MGEYTVITDVGTSLIRLLQKNMIPEPIDKPEMIGLCSPNDPGDFQLTLYLYHIEENGDYRQNSMINENVNRLRYPPLSLKLYYLLTSHSKTGVYSRNADESMILGRAIQILHDNAVITPENLEGTLRDSGEGIQITFNKLTYEELQRIWAFPNIPYKLSVGYIVEPVLLNSRKTREVKRVTEADFSLDVYEGERT